MNLSDYIGQNTTDVKAKLESLGYEVVIKDNSFKRASNQTSLVVKINFIDKEKIELISGEFTFLS